MINIVPQTWVLGGCLVAASLGSMVASSAGWGVTQATKNPPSIREGSVKGKHGHRRRTSYFFIGGGLRGGK